VTQGAPFGPSKRWPRATSSRLRDGGKLRCTGATWSDAVVIFPVEVLALVNIERQAHAIRAKVAKGDKLTITAERIDGGKLRCTGATWSDAVVILQGEALALLNIERQAHAIRAKAPASMVKKEPPAPPISVRIISRPPPDEGSAPPDLREDDFEAPPDEGGARGKPSTCAA
jgi:hypothetical protein